MSRCRRCRACPACRCGSNRSERRTSDIPRFALAEDGQGRQSQVAAATPRGAQRRGMGAGRALELMARARAATGLDNFGDGSFREGLERLVASADAEARLNDLGKAT